MPRSLPPREVPAPDAGADYAVSWPSAIAVPVAGSAWRGITPPGIRHLPPVHVIAVGCRNRDRGPRDDDNTSPASIPASGRCRGGSAGGRAGRDGANLSVAARDPDRAVRGRRADRRGGARRQRAHVAHARPADRGGECRGRRRHGRLTADHAGQSGRLHDPDGPYGNACDRGVAVSQAGLPAGCSTSRRSAWWWRSRC